MLCALLLMAAPAFAQSDPVTTAKRANQMLSAASIKLEQAQQASDRVEALTDTVRAYEEGLSAVRESVRRAAIRQRSIEQSFEAKQDRLSRLLGVLQTIEKSPAPLLLIHPAGPLGTARSGMVLSDVALALQAEAEALRAQLVEVVAMRDVQTNAAIQIRDALIEVQKARANLAEAMANRTELPRSFLADPDRIDALLGTSATLARFAKELSRLDVQQAANLADFETALGTLDPPVAGTVLQGFDDIGPDGAVSPGIKIATLSRALVTTPWPATVRFAGPFLDQGDVVILEPGDGYLMVLSGLGSTYVKEGEILAKGAPVGIMGGNAQNADAFLIDAVNGSGGNQRESLYIEIRQGGMPVDPDAWFTLNRE